MTTLTKKEQILLLVADLGWDYDRMSSSGQKTYDEYCSGSIHYRKADLHDHKSLNAIHSEFSDMPMDRQRFHYALD